MLNNTLLADYYEPEIGHNLSFESSDNFTLNFQSEEVNLDELADLLDELRFIVQRILVPLIMGIGVLGNTITIIVLTRRHMQSSTNCYLTALASSDLLYLLFVLSLSLKHVPGMNHKKHFVYWHYVPFALWLADASSSTSTWLTVVFTVERYIAVCHPMKGKVLCTRSRAKKIIMAVYFICFALTVSTPYEWAIIPDPVANTTHLKLDFSNLGSNEMYRKSFYWFTAVTFILLPLLLLAIFNSFLIMAVKKSKNIRKQMTQKKALREAPCAQQEHKITVMLIAVVVLALFCQMPTAIMLIYTSFKEIRSRTSEFYVSRILGNIFNFLTTVNAACNFVLYCVMSDKYRKTFVETFCGRWSEPPYDNNYSGTSFVGMSVQNSFRYSTRSSLRPQSSNRSMRLPQHVARRSPDTKITYLEPDTMRAIASINMESPSEGSLTTQTINNICESDSSTPLVIHVEANSHNVH